MCVTVHMSRQRGACVHVCVHACLACVRAMLTRHVRNARHALDNPCRHASNSIKARASRHAAINKPFNALNHELSHDIESPLTLRLTICLNP